MATPTVNPEWEEKKEKAFQLIAAGGCHAIAYWSRTDAERLLPKGLEPLEPIDPLVYILDWEREGKKAIELIQKGLDMLKTNNQ